MTRIFRCRFYVRTYFDFHVIIRKFIKSVPFVDVSWSADRSADILELVLISQVFGFTYSFIFFSWWIKIEMSSKSLERNHVTPRDISWCHIKTVNSNKQWFELGESWEVRKKAKIITFPKFWNTWNEITRLDVIHERSFSTDQSIFAQKCCVY